MRRVTTTWILVGLLLAIGGAGASASPAQRSFRASRGCGEVYWRSLRDGDQLCPSAHSMLADVDWIDLRWTRWGRDGALGHGLQVHYNYGPPSTCEIRSGSGSADPYGARTGDGSTRKFTSSSSRPITAA